MTSGSLAEPEFVAHLFAPLDGPNAQAARRETKALWENCRTQLGMTQPIVEAGLVADFPADPAGMPDGALAGLEDPAIQFQAVVRREHDVLNFSLAMAAPEAVPTLRRRVGATAPPGWFEFTRWWRKLSVGGTGALLGGATVYLAKAADIDAVDLRTAVPEQDEDAPGWWAGRLTAQGLAVWEVTPPDTRAARRLVVLAGPDEDVPLSRFAWSAGDAALPPLGRYLMHVAKLRYQARVRGDGQGIVRVRDRAAQRLERLTGLLRAEDGPSRIAGEATLLAADEAELDATLESLRRMRRSVEIARANLTKALAEPFPADAALAEWLTEQLADDAEFVEATRERAERFRAKQGGPPAPVRQQSVLSAPRPDPAPGPDVRVEHRVGFGIDVVGYSSRSTPEQQRVQARLLAMVERVLAGIGVPLTDTDRQNAGDGMMVVLPATVAAHEVLAGLLRGWRALTAADNAGHPHDRIRLRLSVGSGPFTASAIGFSGNSIIEIGRLLDSPVLRRAVDEHRDADVVALVSDRLHQDVVVERYPGLAADEFERQEVHVKTFHRTAWLWTGGAP